jgi:hypothetical protein
MGAYEVETGYRQYGLAIGDSDFAEAASTSIGSSARCDLFIQPNVTGTPAGA